MGVDRQAEKSVPVAFCPHNTAMPQIISSGDIIDASRSSDREDEVKIVWNLRIILDLDAQFTGKQLRRKCRDLMAKLP